MAPETTHLFDEFKCSIGLYQLKNDVQEHHNSNESSQVKFFYNVKNFITCQFYGNHNVIFKFFVVSWRKFVLILKSAHATFNALFCS